MVSKAATPGGLALRLRLQAQATPPESVRRSGHQRSQQKKVLDRHQSI
ncbi:hypothetical protein ABIA69_000518 [Lysinibacillus parviboronicapiens]|uniref:Uncharacterized protein n=1 Tax=Lysinibacillus parviboronicapiens TaxID=436516 RepID=A0ABV2PEL9_9BACI